MINIDAHPLPKATSHTDWLEQRRAGIGSSDASTIVGLNPYSSPYALWQEKTGRAPIDPPVSGRSAELMEWGNLLEPLIREQTAQRLGITITKPEIAYHHKDREWQRANLDGWTQDDRIFEAKSTDARNRKLWVDQIPDHAELQVHHSAAVTGATHAVVAALIGGNELVIHEIEINPTVVEIITEAEEEFWGYVTSDTAPPLDGSVATMHALTECWSSHPGILDVPADDIEPAWHDWVKAQHDLKDAETRKNQALARITALMDGHDRITTGDRVWARAQRGQLNARRFSADHPDIAEAYMRSTLALDRKSLRADHPELYAQYQTVSIRPISAD